MRSKPKVDIIGSCVSRDVFNSRFTTNYKDHVEVEETVYQTALPSLLSQEPVPGITELHKAKNVFIQTLNEEYSGNNLPRVIDSRPDFIIFDFFADVHMGVTRKVGRYVTRNHMAFQAPSDADEYFEDKGANVPERMRFEDDEYCQLAIESLKRLRDQLRSALPETGLIINSARFSTTYKDKGGAVIDFPDAKRLHQKNQAWSLLDEIAANELDAQRISHDSTLFVASSSHPWGLHPVHYTQAYYDNLWAKLHRIIES
jgi:hypothetical protein